MRETKAKNGFSACRRYTHVHTGSACANYITMGKTGRQRSELLRWMREKMNNSWKTTDQMRASRESYVLLLYHTYVRYLLYAIEPMSSVRLFSKVESVCPLTHRFDFSRARCRCGSHPCSEKQQQILDRNFEKTVGRRMERVLSG